MGAAQKSTHLRVRRLPPADLGDGRDDPARQQAAAHRLVLGRLADGDPLQRHSSRNSSVSALTAALGDGKLLRQHGRPRAQPVVGPDGGTRPAFHSGPKTILPPEGKDAATTARCSSSAPNSGTETSQAACGWTEISSYGAADLGHFVETAADPGHRENRRLARLRCGPRRSMSSGRPPLTSSCRGSTKSSPTSKDGREASTTGCVASIAGLSR